MRLGQHDLRPTLGMALVREVELGTTAAGLVMTVAPTHAGKHHEVIEVADGAFYGSTFAPTDLKPGDLAILRNGANRSAMVHFPVGVYLVRIDDVIAFERPVSVAEQAAIAEA